ncbi:MAG TPA: hypothetical protein VM470_05095 [Acidimicrobiia bacterium]|nr:hypothetical protein [Acidimicrobiia bacterium]
MADSFNYHSKWPKVGAMKKLLLAVTVLGLGFLAWRYFSNEPI